MHIKVSESAQGTQREREREGKKVKRQGRESDHLLTRFDNRKHIYRTWGGAGGEEGGRKSCLCFIFLFCDVEAG